jgi:hypothetical protein
VNNSHVLTSFPSQMCKLASLQRSDARIEWTAASDCHVSGVSALSSCVRRACCISASLDHVVKVWLIEEVDESVSLSCCRTVQSQVGLDRPKSIPMCALIWNESHVISTSIKAPSHRPGSVVLSTTCDDFKCGLNVWEMNCVKVEQQLQWPGQRLSASVIAYVAHREIEYLAVGLTNGTVTVRLQPCLTCWTLPVFKLLG